jgi:hypothetical protein
MQNDFEQTTDVATQYVCRRCSTAYATHEEADACRSSGVLPPGTKYVSPNAYNLSEGVLVVARLPDSCKQALIYRVHHAFRDQAPAHRHQTRRGYAHKDLFKSTPAHSQWVPLDRKLATGGIMSAQKRVNEYEASIKKQQAKIKFLQKLLKELK